MNEKNLLSNPLLDNTSTSKELRLKILDLVKLYSDEVHRKHDFIPGKTLIPVSGKVYDEKELQMLVSSSLDFWLTTGRFNSEFEQNLSNFLQVNFTLTCNSGSSANLIALSSLTSNQLENKLNPKDEVITLAAGFPTTVNPIIQNNLIPVFVDVDLSTLSPKIDQIESIISEKTKAIMIAHTLGNPYDAKKIQELCKKHNLWFIEDCCDALGSKIHGKNVGTFGDISTLSFYPAHQITMGEGGAVFTNNSNLKRISESFRDWGRDCFCAPGKNDTCGKRFDWQLGDLPHGYDHKYTYSHVGYNLKITDMQASVGLGQLQKLPEFIKLRQNNFSYLLEGLTSLEKYFILPTPTIHSEPSWFGFPITIRDTSVFSREKIIGFLASKLIDTRPLFSGNITKQPYFKNIYYKISKDLDNTNKIMSDSFWIGIYPAITFEMLDYVIKSFNEFINTYK
ncbi:MAG: lipopolysaccharide biosynthesis protein RfbH [Thaumarchaeota archaeon]|nr:MAG: lipopolysaccharide biosynthesis protein RfbH [Nitrososphaerota archaeon]